VAGLDLSSRLLGAPVSGKRVFLTVRLGCDAYDYACPKGKPSLLELASARKLLFGETLADIRDPSKLVESLRIAQPGSGDPHGGVAVCAAKLC
jgi:hypothetical protein